MPSELEEASSKCKDVVYSFSSYEDSRPNLNKPIDHGPAKYIQKVRVTRASPPKPAYDPLQFVQLKPCSLVKSAQEQIKKSEIVKKCKEDKKEEPEEWQCNLDNWKSSRRKRVEHIIDRVVEVKKFELEEHDRNRRKSKTFNEMLEERGSRRLKPLPIYFDGDNDDLSELGLSTPESSDKFTPNETENMGGKLYNTTSNTDLSEYTYEGAIEVYKSRVSRASCSQTDHLVDYGTVNNTNSVSSKGSENISYSDENDRNVNIEHGKTFDSLQRDVPKIDFLKRKQLFEKEHAVTDSEHERRRLSDDVIAIAVSVKERLSVLQCHEHDLSDPQSKLPPVSFSDLKNRLEIFERDTRNAGIVQYNCSKAKATALPKCSSQDQINNNVKNTEFALGGTSDQACSVKTIYNTGSDKQPASDLEYNENVDSDHEDSGIHTTDVSCSVSQADEQNYEVEHVASGDSNVQTKTANSYNEIEPSISPDHDDTRNANILDDALEMAFQEIDSSELTPMCENIHEPIYQNIKNVENQSLAPELSNVDEPYYQVPKSIEPYYEVPKTIPIPFYENVDMKQPFAIVTEDNVSVGDNTVLIIGLNKLQPPTEKPPPPPPPEIVQETVEPIECCSRNSEDYIEQINSTKHIKKDTCERRSNFLGIEEIVAHNELIKLPTCVVANNDSQHESKHLKNQKVTKSGIGMFGNSDAAESRDSGVSENHSRQSSDFCNVLYDDPDDFMKPKLNEHKILQLNAFKDHQFGHYVQADASQQDILSGATILNKEQMRVKTAI
ncbi:uncharacterized protein CG43427 isoform X2 [Wyeomyia smithii]|uniref:uncharacterized protein CG43427 isoform X2 n=1 Tax=Wyeomyia smithii TaxID=174621 RepID=UPI00246817E3|nr:uncharacterized protein CG43427 isoform X2 [Wyeomyia smithii]